MISLLFAQNSIRADTDTLTGLANAGVPGIIVLLIFANVAMSCVFFWLFVRRETKREKDLLVGEMERNKSLNLLSKTVSEFASMTEQKYDALKEELKELVGTCQEMTEVTIGYQSRFDDHERRLEEHDKTITLHDHRISKIEAEDDKRKNKREK